MDYSPLMHAASSGNDREVEAILNSIKDAPEEERMQYLELRQSSLRMTPLRGLVTGARFCEVNRGVVAGPNIWPNPPKKHQVDHEKCARLLLEAGANPNCKDVMGKTPLMQCCNAFATSASFAVAEELVEFNADLSLKCRLGSCLLLPACLQGRKDCVQKMLELGADPNMVNEIRLGAMMPPGVPKEQRLVDFPFPNPSAKACTALLLEEAARRKKSKKSWKI
ncbi:unnamed protein product [Amoebophrya sp. A25]|nr:unnamed protein product [Amoebophrya sp. A25]|eukprot:GSA25T00011353001.1